MRAFFIYRPLFTLLILFLTARTPAFSQSLSRSQKAELDTLVMQLSEGLAPGLALGIVQNGVVLYEKYHGYAELNHEIPITPRTRFNIASNAKQFTALCMLKLISEEKLGPKEDIRKYLPELYKNYEGSITIEQLITHSSGIRDIYNLLSIKGKTWWATNGLDNGDALELLEQQTGLNFAPGSQYLYSNSNYILLTEIVSRVVGQSFAKYAKELFESIGMPNTEFATNYMNLMPFKSRPYANWGTWKEYPSITDVHGDGGLFSTLEDQMRWEQIVQGKANDVLSKELVGQSQAPLPGAAIQSYGYGLEFSTFRGLPYIYHDGATGAYNASLHRFPEQRLSILVLSNSGQVAPNYLAKQCANILIPSDQFRSLEYPQRPEKLSSKPERVDILGYYKTPEGSLIRFLEEAGSLVWKIGQNRPFPFNHVEGNLYEMTEDPRLRISYHLMDEDEPHMIIYYPGSEPRYHTKLLPVEEPKTYFKTLEGTYYNEEVAVEVKLEYRGDKSYDVRINGDRSQALMLEKDVLRMQGYVVDIQRNDQGQVQGIQVNDNRVRRLNFNRK
ncbi:MAG: beta-lactamase family protein [Saprospiraceae bacterium]|nr:beta-lactamase family protein [Saprospiraceae bacterium]